MAIPPSESYGPPEPWKESQYIMGLRVILAVALAFVFVSVGLFAYFTAIGPSDGGNGWIGGPNVQFSAASPVGANEWIITVAGVSQAVDYDNFMAVLLRDGVQEGEVMNPLQETTVDYITFADLDGGGRLTVGDYFTSLHRPGAATS